MSGRVYRAVSVYTSFIYGEHEGREGEDTMRISINIMFEDGRYKG